MEEDLKEDQFDDDDLISDCVDVLTQLALSPTGIVNDHLNTLLPNLLQLFTNNLPVSIRESSSFFLRALAEHKPRILGRSGFMREILEAITMTVSSVKGSAARALFTYAPLLDDQDEEEDEYDEETGYDGEDRRALQQMTQTTLDLIALHVPSVYLFDDMMEIISGGMNDSNDSGSRKAGCAMLGVVAEGFQDRLRESLPSTLPALISLLGDEDYTVRECSGFCIGQFCEHIQPDIFAYHAGIIPAAIQALTDPRTTVQVCPFFRNIFICFFRCDH